MALCGSVGPRVSVSVSVIGMSASALHSELALPYPLAPEFTAVATPLLALAVTPMSIHPFLPSRFSSTAQLCSHPAVLVLVPVHPLPLSSPVDLFPHLTSHVLSHIVSPLTLTHHQPWPLIERFLATLPAGALGLDAGAGNGKYLPAAAAAGAWAIALDRSKGLLDIARGQLADTAECVRGDLCDVPWRSGLFVSRKRRRLR